MSQNSAQADSLVILMAQALVDCPQDVKVRTIEGSNTMVLELEVAKADVGKVIGKQGRTAHAMRTLLKAVSSKTKKHMVLEIIE